MKTRLFVAGLISVSLALFLANAFAHYQVHYDKDGVKVETKKIDKGIQVTITSDDPEIAKDIQENSRYYEEALAYGGYCPHMERMAYRSHGCRW